MCASTKLAIKYAIFAFIATVANIGAQDVVVRSYGGPFDLAASIAVGTGVGLIVKYVLDKRFIFYFQAQGMGHDTHTFILYTIMGVATTAIFWGFEFSFHYAFATREMRYVGGALGLTIGYLAKYQLDKRYVFRTEHP